MLSEQAAEARREYKRRWAKENPDKIRAQQDRYWTRRAQAQAMADQQAEAKTAQVEPEKDPATT